MKSKLENAGIAFEEITVFGAIRCNVHVKCLSRETAHKWSNLLVGVFGAKPSMTATTWDAVENKGTNLLPTKRSGFLVAIAG